MENTGPEPVAKPRKYHPQVEERRDAEEPPEVKTLDGFRFLLVTAHGKAETERRYDKEQSYARAPGQYIFGDPLRHCQMRGGNHRHVVNQYVQGRESTQGIERLEAIVRSVTS
jgi:hypothetical protein